MVSTESGNNLLEELGETRVRELAMLLRLPTSCHSTMETMLAWLEGQKRFIETELHKDLKAGRWSWIKRNLDNPGPGGKLEPCCVAHKGLDSSLIDWCSTLLQIECTVRCDFARIWIDKVDENKLVCEDYVLLDQVRDFTQKISGIGSLWQTPAEFEEHCGDVNPQHRFQRIKSGCGACMLSFVGARRDLLVILKSNMEARAKRENPRLLALVEAWVDLMDPSGGTGMRNESARMAQQLRPVRSQVRQRRALHATSSRSAHRSSHRGGLPEDLERLYGVPLPARKIRDRDFQDQVVASPQGQTPAVAQTLALEQAPITARDQAHDQARDRNQPESRHMGLDGANDEAPFPQPPPGFDRWAAESISTCNDLFTVSEFESDIEGEPGAGQTQNGDSQGTYVGPRRYWKNTRRGGPANDSGSAPQPAAAAAAGLTTQNVAALRLSRRGAVNSNTGTVAGSQTAASSVYDNNHSLSRTASIAPSGVYRPHPDEYPDLIRGTKKMFLGDDGGSQLGPRK